MKKLVIKTALITLGAIIVVALAAYGIVARVAPSTLADFYAKMHNYSLTVKYEQRQYERSGEFSDLAALCAELDERRDAEKTAKFVAMLVDDEGFSEYCKKTDESFGNISTAEFYNGKLVLALYRSRGVADACERAVKAVEKYGYTKNNPFNTLIADSKDAFSADDKAKITDCINGLIGNLSDEGKAFAASDLEALSK